MNAYDFCRATARHIDRRLGMTLASGVVEDYHEELWRFVDIQDVAAALDRTVLFFSPEVETDDVRLPQTTGALARQLIRVVFDDEPPEPEIFVREPVMQKALAAAVRLFIEGILNCIADREAGPQRLRPDLPPHLAREVERLMRLPHQAITAKA